MAARNAMNPSFFLSFGSIFPYCLFPNLSVFTSVLFVYHLIIADGPKLILPSANSFSISGAMIPHTDAIFRIRRSVPYGFCFVSSVIPYDWNTCFSRLYLYVSIVIFTIAYSFIRSTHQSTIASGGVHRNPVAITRIEDRQGNVIASFVPAVSDAISEQTAYTMVQMLQNNVRTGTGGRLRWMYGFSDVEMGGKTGTSQEGRDAWFMGVTPNLVAGTWVGCEDQSAYLLSGAEGASIALPVFAGFMKQVYEDPSCGVRRTDRFYRPAGAIEYDCPDSEAPDRMQDDEFFE